MKKLCSRMFKIESVTGCLMLFLVSCASQHHLMRKAKDVFLNDSSLTHAHVGFAVVDCGKGNTILSHNASHYFVPASNMKLLTLYAGMKLLPSHVPGIRYKEKNDTLYLMPTGDPTFLHPDFQQQPVFDFLKQQQKAMVVSGQHWQTQPWGKGWSWDDYRSSYMPERSPLPVYGNAIQWTQLRTVDSSDAVNDTSFMIFSDPEVQWDVRLSDQSSGQFTVERSLSENKYQIKPGPEMIAVKQVPFVTGIVEAAIELLKDTLHQSISCRSFSDTASFQTIYSCPSDSLFRYFMHRSNNLMAEQTLLMLSDRMLNVMNEQTLIASLLNTLFVDFPQKPVWVDGSGLSRYNLMTPENFVWLLCKMNDEFSMERLRSIFPGSKEGTLRNALVNHQLKLFAKTGTLSGHTALSGYLYTKSNRLLSFSILVNHYVGSSIPVRRAIERFLSALEQQ
jgi:D-alanyl-D-alanine carboxypeptidase/D-alanyl-D-alanine-endopeptidase (penicillin-binding protein 4)